MDRYDLVGAFDTVLEPLAKELDQNQFDEQQDADIIEVVNRLTEIWRL